MAAVLATAFTWVVFRRLRATQQRPISQIVAAANDLPAGVALSPNDITMVDWPADVAMPGSFTKKEDVLGHPLIHSRSEEHTSELQSHLNLVCRLLLEKKKK